MKTADDTTTKDHADTAKSASSRSSKRAAPKKTAAATRSKSRSAAKRRPASAASALSGYSDTAAKLISRGKSAFGDMYSWAGEAGSAQLRSARASARNLHMPDQRTMRDYVTERPLILGAVGLGIGMALAAMMPHSANTQHSTARRTRRK